LRRIFISHSSRDNEVAKSLKDYLEVNGHRSLFLDFDPADGIPAGRDWERELYQQIRACQAMIVICSRDSMASRWCNAPAIPRACWRFRKKRQRFSSGAATRLHRVSNFSTV
jgi:TIR domain